MTRPGRPLLDYLLAGFSILLLSASLALHHRLLESYRQAVQDGRPPEARARQLAEADARRLELLVAGSIVAAALAAALLGYRISRSAVRSAPESEAPEGLQPEDVLEAQARNRFMFETNPNPMWIYDTDTLHFLAVNGAAVSHYGYSREEFLAMTVREIRPPGEVDRLVKNRETARAFQIHPTVWRHRKKDGSLVDVEISSHRLDFAGRRARIVLAVDVTARQRAEEELRRSEERLRLVARATNDGVWDWKVPTGETWWNDALYEMFEYRRGETQPSFEAWARKLHPEDRPRVLAGVEAALAGRDESWNDEFRVLRADGSALHVLDRCHIQRDADGRPVRLTGAMLDITGIRRAEEEVRRSQLLAALGSLVGGVAHEVRNPLFGISSTIDAFEARFGDRAEFERYLTVLRGEVDRLRTLMDDLLEFGRPPSLDLTIGSLEDVIAQAMRACAPLAEQAGVRIASDVAAALPPLRMDRPRLVQVFQNLIQNAVQHAPAGSVVRIEAEAGERGGRPLLRCRIRDSGPGLRDEDLQRLFEPFFTRRRGGTGLGLSIVHRIVEQHGGSVTAANHPAGGAVLAVSLPLAEAVDTRPTAASVKLESAPPEPTGQPNR